MPKLLKIAVNANELMKVIETSLSHLRDWLAPSAIVIARASADQIALCKTQWETVFHESDDALAPIAVAMIARQSQLKERLKQRHVVLVSRMFPLYTQQFHVDPSKD